MRIIKLLCVLKLLCILGLLAFSPQAMAGIDTKAKYAIMIDLSTGQTLFEKQGDTKMPTASMSKVMTVYAVFDYLKKGLLSLDDQLIVSEKAWAKGGSKMWVEVGTKVLVEDLIRGVIVQSGNDASIVLAEGISGSEEAFAKLLNEYANKLGMQSSHFTNATGWPDPNHYSTPRDLALLARRLVEDFPEYYHYYSEKEFTYSDIRQPNRNPLLQNNVEGVDGLKTGHTQEAGYGLIASAERSGRRLMLVVSGLESEADRSREAERILEWGFRAFDRYELFENGESVIDTRIWLGAKQDVAAIVPQSVTVTMERAAQQDLSVTAKIETPIAAPVVKGQNVGMLEIAGPGFETFEVPLVAADDVPQLGLFGRIIAGGKHLLAGEADE